MESRSNKPDCSRMSRINQKQPGQDKGNTPVWQHLYYEMLSMLSDITVSAVIQDFTYRLGAEGSAVGHAQFFAPEGMALPSAQ